ncbi:MAG TPA: Xaa-Pro peptidase family protein [Polyangiaceae bacterium]
MFRRGFLQALVSGVACACGPRPAGVTIAAPAAPSAGRAPLAPLDPRVFLARVDRVRALAREAGAEWTFVSSGTTSFAYLTGASIERSERLIALLVPAAGDPVLVAPSFEVERVRRSVRFQASIRGWEESQSPFDVVRDAAASRGAVLVEPHGEYGTAMALSRALPDARLVDGSAAFASLRVVKQPEELARIRRAVAITHDVFDRAFAELRPGVRDRDVSQAIASAFEREGYEGYALVQFGALSALPHGPPAGDGLASDVAVLIDGGCRVDGYWSDVTRTRWFGSSPPAEFRRVADVVAEAQRAGIDRARPGVEAQEVDRAARAIIAKAGYGSYFTHRTGHGLGMDGHEPIYMVEGNRTPLVPGCVFTVEPGIYLPGRFGVRIEDDVVCEDASARVLEGA